MGRFMYEKLKELTLFKKEFFKFVGKNRLVIGLALTATMLLTGCSGVPLEEAQNQPRVFHKDYTSELDELLKVGEELRLEKVTYGRYYKFMYVNANGQLIWIDARYMSLNVKKSEKGYSYVYRGVNNTKEAMSDGYKATASNYALYVHTDGLEGGSYSEKCGKNCTREVKVDTLD